MCLNSLAHPLQAGAYMHAYPEHICMQVMTLDLQLPINVFPANMIPSMWLHDGSSTVCVPHGHTNNHPVPSQLSLIWKLQALTQCTAQSMSQCYNKTLDTITAIHHCIQKWHSGCDVFSRMTYWPYISRCNHRSDTQISILPPKDYQHIEHMNGPMHVFTWPTKNHC